MPDRTGLRRLTELKGDLHDPVLSHLGALHVILLLYPTCGTLIAENGGSP